MYCKYNIWETSMRIYISNIPYAWQKSAMLSKMVPLQEILLDELI